MTDLQKGYDALLPEQKAFFSPYCFNTPIALPAAMLEELTRLGKALFNAIHYLHTHYRSFTHIFPYTECQLKKLDGLANYPFRAGTFRGDFVFTQEGGVKIIEFNSGQPLNGAFTSGYLREIGLEQAARGGISPTNHLYSGFLNYVEEHLDGCSHVVALYGDEVPSERRIYAAIFAAAGVPCYQIHITDIAKNLHLIENALVIQELLPAEIWEQPQTLLERLCSRPLLNHPFTALYPGSKRFLYAVRQEPLFSSVFTEDEQRLVERYIVNTYLPGFDGPVWEDALHHRERYLLKHHCLGRSEEVYAGILTPRDAWEALFREPVLSQMVLQDFVEQPVVTGYCGEERREDHVTGLLLYWNDRFFGPGLYRTSASPVHTNKEQFRKIASI